MLNPRILLPLAAVVLFAHLPSVVARGDDAERWGKNSTLQNLMEAFNGESNAHAKYVVYAKKAEEEGFVPVASLFRAAARAEKIHADNHAEVIRALGGEPKADIKLPQINSTRENLLDAVKGEVYERDKMYPAFIKAARETRSRGALRSFNFALVAETEHANLYQYAVDHLDQYKGGEKQTYVVCVICGYTLLKKDFKFEKCPSCYSPREKYVEVS